ncbi:MAG: DUF2357 domain-containing protein [Candidatus Izemoplasmatales bacterium]|nr:DUF2357 domain-containing protein [Candidatus Izemoplasmatales bacterium]
MKTKFDLELLKEKIEDSFEQIEDSVDFPSYFFQAFYEGKREIYQKEFSQIKLFDEKWIRTIESYYPSLATITKRLKSTLKYEEEILPIEKTKKVGQRAIRHLSSHSELIRQVDDEDEVVPEKVLSSQSEVEYGIYENRFVMTLIRRLQTFISERLKIIEQELEGVRDTHLSYETEFNFTDIDYEIKIDLKQKERYNKRKANEHNQKVFERATYLHKLISHLNNSEFMRIMKKYKPVAPPIMKTQIILKNPDFKNAYLLWLFLDKYYILDYHLDTKTINKRFSPEYQKQIDRTMCMLFSTFFQNDHSDLDGETEGKAKYRTKKAVQRKTIVDEIDIDPFVYEVEPQIANEYFLEKNRAIFKKELEEAVKEKPNFTLGLKSAVTQNLKIVNDLYASFFEINQDVDVFQRLVQSEDPIDKYEETNKKLKIAKAIREVKEKDYKEAIKLEKKWQRQLLAKQKEVLSLEKDELNSKIKDKIESIKKTYSEEYELKQKEASRQKELYVRNQKDEINLFTKKINSRFEKQLIKLKEAKREELNKKIEKITKEAEIKKVKQTERLLARKEKLRKDLLDKKSKLREKNKLKLEKEKKKIQDMAIKKKLLEKQKQEKKLEREKNRLEKENMILTDKINEVNQEIKN